MNGVLASDISRILDQIHRPPRAVITAGMPYANGPLHLGHLAGAHLPADIYARWMRMLIGRESVLYVCGTDDHGSASELAAIAAGTPIRDFVDRIRREQSATLAKYSIDLDLYTGTSTHDCFPIQKAIAHTFLRRLHHHGMLEKRTTRQWFDPKMARFLQDRLVSGRCPNPACDNDRAYSDECERCGVQYDPAELIDARSAISDAKPILKETVHWWLNMWKVSEVLRQWIHSKANTWRSVVFSEAISTVLPSLRFDKTHEDTYKGLKGELPKHKSRYAARKRIVLQFDTKEGMIEAQASLARNAVPTTLVDEWAYRSITRDVAWGIPVPDDLDPEMAGKTLYVWPDSLIAPLSFTQVALQRRGEDPARYVDYWTDPDTRIAQFLGQDNVFFYVLMQGALWLGTQDDPMRLPRPGEYQLTDVFASYHLKVEGDKMSKSRGNYFTGDQLLERGYTANQIRYFLALLKLSDKAANFDFETLDERNRFLAGPINAAFERPISAAHSKFGGRVPDGTLMDKVVADTVRIVRRYVKAMERAEYSTLLYDIEVYARLINSLFTQYKPHDDRYPEAARRDALYSAFYVLKTLMIMLYPIVPDTMDRLRVSLALEPDIFRVSELGTPIPAGHALGAKQEYFPAVVGARAD